MRQVGVSEPLSGLGSSSHRRQAAPEFIPGWGSVDVAFLAGEVVELDDALTVGGVGELQARSRRTLWLLEPVAGGGVGRLGLDDGDSMSGR